MGDGDEYLITQEFYDDLFRMPEIDYEFTYLLEWIHEIGFCMAGAMSAIVISYSELHAWNELTQNNATPFDIELMRTMSRVFISAQESSKKFDTIDPLKLLLEKEND